MDGRHRSRHAWAGALSLWPGRALYVGPAFGTTPHAHHAVQVSIGLSGAIRIRRNTAARWQRPHAALVAPDQEHQLDGEGGRVALLYLDPESTEGFAVAARAGARGVASVAPGAVAACRRAVDIPDLHRPDIAEGAVAAILAALVPSSTVPRRLDPRIREATASLTALDDARPTAVVYARGLGLSASRFGHLFREHTGLPFRRYVLWTRLQRAVREVTAGRPLTDAALVAGFADAAHLSRTFRRMFGIAPSELGVDDPARAPAP